MLCARRAISARSVPTPTTIAILPATTLPYGAKPRSGRRQVSWARARLFASMLLWRWRVAPARSIRPQNRELEDPGGCGLRAGVVPSFQAQIAASPRDRCGSANQGLRRFMPSQQEVRWSQLKVGVIVLVSAVILTTLLFLMTSASGLGVFSHKLTVTSYFANAGGLKVGAVVELEGYTIGNVKTIAVVTTPERKLTPVQVVMRIEGKYQPSLHTDSTAALSSVGI